MSEKIIKRGYYFPEKLLDEWEEFHLPNKSFGSSPEGAFLIWLALEDLPQVREKAGKLAHSDDIKESVEAIRELLIRSLTKIRAEDELRVQNLPPELPLIILKLMTLGPDKLSEILEQL